VISEHAWPVLDWLLTVLEKDEAHMQSSGSSRYSPLLICQIPSHSYFDLTAPLKVAFAVLSLTPFRQEVFALGMRLIQLIINLTSTSSPRSLPPSECLLQIHSSLISITDGHSRASPSNFLRSFFAALQPTGNSFKLRLACFYAASHSIGMNPAKFLVSGSVGNSVKPKPATRRRPQAKLAALSSDTLKDDGPNSTAISAATSETRPTTPFPMPSIRDILDVLVALPDLNRDDCEADGAAMAPPVKTDEDERARQIRLCLHQATAKFYILSEALRLYCRQDGYSAELDPEWRNSVIDGRMERAVQQAFVVPECLKQVETDGDTNMGVNDVKRTASAARQEFVALGATAAMLLATWKQR